MSFGTKYQNKKKKIIHRFGKRTFEMSNQWFSGGTITDGGENYGPEQLKTIDTENTPKLHPIKTI